MYVDNISITSDSDLGYHVYINYSDFGDNCDKVLGYWNTADNIDKVLLDVILKIKKIEEEK